MTSSDLRVMPGIEEEDGGNESESSELSSLMDSSLDDADDDGSLTGMADGNESIQGADDGFSSNSAQKQQQLRRPQSKGWPVSAMSSSSLSSSLPDYSSSTPSSPAFIVSTTQKSQTSVTPAQQQPRKRGRPKKAQPTTPQYPAGLLAGGSMYTPQQLEALQAQSIGFMNSFNVAALVSGSSSASVLNSAIAKKSTPYGRYLFYIPQPTDLVEVEKILFYRQEKGDYLVKFKLRSYLHCEYVTTEWLDSHDLRSKQRIKHFHERVVNEISYSLVSEDAPFPSAYTTIDRVLAEADFRDPFSKENTHWFLVKWQSLPYDQCSWESEADLAQLYEDPEELEENIAAFRRFNMLPQKRDASFYDVFLSIGERPPLKYWSKIEPSARWKDDNSLRDYQLEGLNWLLYCWYNRQSSIIADEMGLGKTVQSITFLERLYNSAGVRGPFLIVAPLSTIPHWERTVHGWTDLNCVVYHGNANSRGIIQNYEFHHVDEETGRRITTIPSPRKGGRGGVDLASFKFDILITTYEMCLNASAVLKSIPCWRVVIVDEAHRLKNKTSKFSEVLKSYTIEHRVLLTGTPIQNNLEELWALLNFLDPRSFPDGTERKFLADYDLRSAADVERLQALLKPLMLRRLKEDVETTIPVKEETIIDVELTSIQRAYYRAILERNFTFLRTGTKKTNFPNLINTMLELRKCCIHPYLITGAEDKVIKDQNALTPQQQFQCMVDASGKLVLLDKLLPKLKAGGHRVLIFSQMTRCLDILQDYLRGRGYTFERIDGGVRGDARQAAIDRFSREGSDVFCFLLCTRAGGVGINLTAADTCVIYDSDWNPQNDLQAQARCHRIGQTKNVKIYRLLTRNTYEMTMFEKAGMKLGLDKAVLSRMDSTTSADYTGAAGDSNAPSALSKSEVEELLKKGAYAALAEENDEEEKKFRAEDIDQILARRSTVIRHDETENRPADPSLFSKATFSLNENQSGSVELDDPEFWDKWARRAQLNPEQLIEEQKPTNDLIVQEPRRRKKRSDFGDLTSDGELGGGGGGEDGTGRGKRHRYRPGINHWTMADRQKLERLMMVYGFGAWEKKKESFPTRSIKDLKAAEQRLILWCLEKLRKEREKSEARTKEDLRFFEDVETALESLRWQVPDEKKVQEMCMGNCNSSFDRQVEAVETDPELGPYPYPGATRDQLLMYLSFMDEGPPEYFEHLSKKPRNLLLRVANLHLIRRIFDLDPHACGDVLIPLTAAAIAVPSEATGSQISSSAAAIIQKQKYDELFNKRREQFKFHQHYHSLFNASVEGAHVIDGWAEAEDRDLLLGMVKYGYQNYEQIRTDPQLSYLSNSWHPPLPIKSSAAAVLTAPPPKTIANSENATIAPTDGDVQMEDAPVAAEEPTSSTSMQDGNESVAASVNDGVVKNQQLQSSQERHWPPSADLGIRIRRLILTCQRMVRRDNSSAQQTGGRRVETTLGEHQWSRKDRSEFMRGVSTWGLPQEEPNEDSVRYADAIRFHWRLADEAECPQQPDDNCQVHVKKRDWSQFKHLVNLEHKSDWSLDVFCELFLRRADEMIRTDQSGIGNTTITDDVWDRIAKYRKLLDAPKSAEWPFDPVDLAELVQDSAGQSLDPCEGMAGERAKRLFRRIALMHTIREEVLKDPFLDIKLTFAKRSNGLPDWWVAGTHDKPFLEGISKYGMTPLHQNMIMFDPEFPFAPIIEQKLIEAGLGDRLEYLKQRATRPKYETGDAANMIGNEDEEEANVADDTNIEEITGWPRDVVRTRRVEILIELIAKPTGAMLETIRYFTKKMKDSATPSSSAAKKRKLEQTPDRHYEVKASSGLKLTLRLTRPSSGGSDRSLASANGSTALAEPPVFSDLSDSEDPAVVEKALSDLQYSLQLLQRNRKSRRLRNLVRQHFEAVDNSQ